MFGIGVVVQHLVPWWLDFSAALLVLYNSTNPYLHCSIIPLFLNTVCQVVAKPEEVYS